MNERIRELKFQAAAQVSPLLEGSEWQQVYSEKFAELIVRRAISVYNNSETFKTSTYDDNRVLEYFGFEE